MSCKIVEQTRPVFCETYPCVKRAKYSVGNPSGPLSKMVNYCEDCLKSMIDSIPVGLLPQTEPEEAKHKCEYCGQTFKNQQSLAAHTRFCKQKGDD